METAVKLYDRDCENFAPPRNRADYGMENVLAALVRRRGLSLKQIERRWKLTPSQARSVMHAQASRAVLRKIIKQEGWSLGLVMLTDVIGHDLATHIEKERERERTTWQRLDRGLRDMGDNLRAMRSVDADRRD